MLFGSKWPCGSEWSQSFGSKWSPNPFGLWGCEHQRRSADPACPIRGWTQWYHDQGSRPSGVVSCFDVAQHEVHHLTSKVLPRKYFRTSHPSWMWLSPICVYVYPLDFALPFPWVDSQRPLQVAKRTVVVEIKFHPQNLLDFHCLLTVARRDPEFSC